MMRVVRDFHQVGLDRVSSVTIGVFDGLHRGHRYLIGQMVRDARQADRLAVVVTFFPHPAIVLGEATPPFYLLTLEERLAHLEALGVDLTVLVTFTPETARIRAADFVAALVRHLHMASLWVGQDFALGYRREGDLVYLRRAGERHRFSVHAIPPLEAEGRVISSNRIRQALREGDLDDVARCLGHPFQITGTPLNPSPAVGAKVLAGADDAPSSLLVWELQVWPERLLPAPGIYASRIRWDGRELPALAEIHPAFQAPRLYLAGNSRAPLSPPERCTLDFLTRLREQPYRDPEERSTRLAADLVRIEHG